MTYPYGTKGAPVVGNGLGGLPSRVTGPSYFSNFGEIKNRWVLPFTNTSASLSFDFSAIPDLRRVSFRVISSIVSGTLAGSGGEVFPFMNTTIASSERVSIAHRNSGTTFYVTYNRAANDITVNLSSGTTQAGYIVITEYKFTYNFLGEGSFYSGSQTGFTDLTLLKPIKDLRSVFVSVYASTGNDGANYSMAQNTFQPSGYYGSAETIFDIALVYGLAVDYTRGGFFTNNLTFRYYRSGFLGAEEPKFRIFEITGTS